MVYYGKGGFNFKDVYEMPVHIRNFYFQQMIKAVEKEKQAMDKATARR